MDAKQFPLWFFLCLTCGQSEKRDFRNFEVVKMFGNEALLRDWLKKDVQLRINIEIHTVPGALTVAVPPGIRTLLRQRLDSVHVKYEVISNNLQDLIDAERSVQDTDGHFNYYRYHNLEEINENLFSLAKNHSNRLIYESIGQTLAGRNIHVARIVHPEASSDVLIECGIHAREWIGPASCLWIINQLTVNPVYESLTKNFRFHIIPVLNVDGYSYTWEVDRTWRKNRRPITKACNGVDLNRNFDFYFGQVSSSDPCSNNYAGQEAFSEKETQVLRDYAINVSNSGNIAMSFSMHSFGQLLMYPSGVSAYNVTNGDELKRLAEIGAQAIKNTHGQVYTVGPIHSTIYPASGSTVDWYHSKGICRRPFAVELRNKESFILPPNQIKPTAEEIWNAIQSMLKEIK